MSNRNSGGHWELVKTILYASAIAISVRTAAYEPFSIPSGSMIPTLLVGDYLFVSKFSYGYSRHSLPFSLPLISERIFFEPPERGDVAVFKLPADNKTDYIKRIIGLPGDSIQVKGGILHINGKSVGRQRADDYINQDANGNLRRMARFVETLPNGRSHYILEVTDHGMLDNTPVFKVPPGHFFAMGDNRDNSLDSRTSGVGFVPMENLVGRAEFLWFSVNGSAWKVWQWPTTARIERFFEAVE